MRRFNINAATGILLLVMWCCASPVFAAVPISEAGQLATEPDASELIRARQAHIQRSTAIDQEQPVDWTCGNQPGFQSPDDGPAVSSALCDGSFIQLVDTPAGSEIQLIKSSPTVLITAPGPVNYNYLVTNSGSTTLDSVMLSDNHVDNTPSCPQAVLQQGESMTCNATYTVTEADIANFGSPVPGSGLLENDATVVADGGGVSATDSLQIPFDQPVPDISLTKSSQTTLVSAPGPVSYDYLVTNTGSVPLMNIELEDNHVDSGTSCPLFTLNPGESMTCNAVYTVTMADITNMGSPDPGSGFLVNDAIVSAAPGVSAVDTLQIPILEPDPTNPLVLLPQGSSIGMVPAGEPYEFTFTTVGGEPPIMFSGSGAPPGLAFSQDENLFTLSGTPQEAGQFIITVTATDSAQEPNETSRIYSLRVEGDSDPVLPTLPETALPDAIEGQPYQFGLAILGGTPPFEFAASGLPQGLDFVLDGNVLTLSGTAGESGDFVIDVTVTDSADPVQSDSQSYNLRVVPELLLLPQDPFLGFARVDSSYQTSFLTEGGLSPVTISGGNAPPGLEFELSGDELILSGTPTTIGDYTFTVSAQDAMTPPQTSQRDYSLSVVLALDIQPETLPDAIVGEDYLAALSVMNGIPPFMLDMTGLPPGLVLNGNAITGNPDQSGTFTLTALANDAVGNTGSRDLLLNVRAPGDVVVGGTLPDAYLNTEYGYQLSAVGAAAPLTWSGGGGLPPGFTLENTGLVNGVAQQTGPFSFNATVSAVDGSAFSGTFNVMVLDPDLISANPGFPSGQTGVAYNSPTAIRGGTAPFDCEIIGGSLPPGLSLNGCNAGIDGTPTEPGSYPFSLGVMDSGNPALAAEIDGIIQVAETSPIPDPLPPDLDFQPPLNIPVAELSAQSPDTGLPDETLQGLAVDDWGNRYVVGFSFNGSNYDIRTLKFSTDGELLWDQVYDSGDHDYGYGITVQASRQAVYASGYSLVGNSYLAVLIRYDLTGVEQWLVNNDSNSQVTAYYGLAADNNGVYAIGERYNGSNFDALVTRYSHTGSLQWENVRSTSTTRTGYAITNAQCGDSSCLLIGGAEGQTNRSGWVEQIQSGSGAASPLATISSAPVFALQTVDGGFVSAGSSDADDWFINAFNQGGGSQWNLTLTAGDNLRGLARDRNGFLYAAGSGNSATDGLLVLISPEGEILGTTLYDIGVTEVFRGVIVTPDGRITTAGQRSDASGNRFLVVDFNTGKAN